MVKDVELFALIPEKQIALCLTPKVASMSIITALSNYYGARVQSPTRRNTVFRWFTQQQVLKLIPDWKRAIFVRDPWDRVCSAYNYHILQKQIIHTKNLQKYFNTKTTFTEFLDEVTRNPYGDLHYTPQSKIISRIDFVGKFENLIEDWDRFRSWSGLVVPNLPHVNKVRKKKDFIKKATPAQIKKYKQAFKDDYKTFGYGS